MNITEFRSKYPQYNDMSDEDLATSFHKKYYSDIPYEDFSKKFLVGSGGNSTDYRGGFKVFGETPGAQALPTVAGLARAGSGMVGTVLGGFAGALEGLADPRKTVLQQGEKRGSEWGEAFKEFIPPISNRTKDVEKNMLEPAFDAMRQAPGKVAETLTTMGRMGEMTKGTNIPEAARTIGEVGFDVLGAGALGASAGRGVVRGREQLAERAKARDAADAALETPKPVENPIVESLLSEIEKAELIKNGGDLTPNIPKKVPRGKGLPEEVDYFKGRDIIPDDTFVSSERLRAADAEQAPLIERTRSGRDMLDEPIPPRQREMRFEEPTIEPPVPPRTLPREPEQLGFNFDEARTPRAERLAIEELRNKPIEDRLMSLEEQATRMADELRQTNQLRDRLYPEDRPTTTSGAIPAASPRTVPDINQVPRGQRGAANFGLAEAVTEGISTLWNKALKIDEKQQRVRERIKSINQSDRDATSAVAGEERPVADFYKSLPGGKPTEFDLLRNIPWQREKSLPARVKQALARMPREAASELAMLLSDPGSVAKWTQHPIATYVPDRVRSIVSRWNMFNDVMKEGVRFDFGGLRTKKLVDPDSIAARREHLSFKEKQQVAELANDINLNPQSFNRAELMSRGYGQKAIDLVEKMQKNLKSVLDEVNNVLEKSGRPRIQELPHYLMKYFGEGNYVTRIVDEKGKTLWFHRTKTMPEGAALAEKYKVELEKQGVSGKIQETKYQSQSELADKMNLAPGVIKDIENALAKDDPRRAILQEIDRKFLNEARAGGHAGKRKGVAGGEMDAKTVFKAYDRYIDQMTTYAKHVEIGNIWKEMQQHPDSLPTNGPTMKWTKNYIDSQVGATYKGGDLIGGMESWLNDSLQMHRIGGVRTVNKLASRMFTKSAMLFLNVPFSLAAWGQSPVFTIPGINTYARQKGLSGSAGKAMTTAIMDMIEPTKDQRAFLNWEAGRGSIDPTAIREWSSVNTKLDKITDYAMLEILPKSGEKFGRVHSSLAAYNFLKENGYKGKDLWQEAERISRDYVMGDYSTTGRARLVRDTGFVGDAARTLSTFYNFYINQVGSMLDLASRGKPGPFVQFYLLSTLSAGMIGAPFIGAINDLWDVLKANKWFQQAAKKEGFNINENSPTASEWIMQNMPDAAVFGPLDAMTGIRMSGSMAAPEMHFPGETKYGQFGSALFPGPVYLYDTITSSLKLLADQLNPSLSRAEQTALLKKAAPSKAVDGIIENWDIMTSDRDTSSMGKRGAGGYRRDTGDVVASIIGSGTLAENRAKVSGDEQRTREIEVSEVRTRLLTRLGDMIVDNDTENPNFDKLTEKLVELGVKPSEISALVRKNVKDRYLTKEERDVGRASTPRQQRRLIDQLLREEAASP